MTNEHNENDQNNNNEHTNEHTNENVTSDINQYIQRDEQGNANIGGVPVNVSALEELFSGVTPPVGFGRPCEPQQTQQTGNVVVEDVEVAPIVTVGIHMERNEAGAVTVKWDAENPQHRTGVIILDFFRGYLLSLIGKAQAAHTGEEPLDIMPILHREQAKLNAIYPFVLNSASDEFVLDGIEIGEVLPKLEAVKPVDQDYDSFAVNGSFEDIGVCIHILMAAYIKATANSVLNAQGIVLFRDTLEGTILQMGHNEAIRATKCMDLLNLL